MIGNKCAIFKASVTRTFATGVAALLDERLGWQIEFSALVLEAYLLENMKSHALSYIVVFCINQVCWCKLSN